MSSSSEEQHRSEISEYLDISVKPKIFYRPKHAKPEQRPNIFFTTAICIGIAIAIVVIFNVMFGIAVIKGSSMEPSLYEGDIVIFWKLSGQYQDGDIVLIKTDTRDDYVKRIVAIPGDQLDIDDNNGCLFVNKTEKDEPYIYEKTYSKSELFSSMLLLENEYYVLGDKRSDSRDSRNYGAVNSRDIEGKSLIIFKINGQNR